jgi:hypothetical protein
LLQTSFQVIAHDSRHYRPAEVEGYVFPGDGGFPLRACAVFEYLPHGAAQLRQIRFRPAVAFKDRGFAPAGFGHIGQ